MNELKRIWERLAVRFDDLTLRERAMGFAIAALAMITLMNVVVVDPMLSKQRAVAEKIKGEQQQIAAMRKEIEAKIKAHEVDPDTPNRERLRALAKQMDFLRKELQGVQQGLVSPDKMATLLEELLRRNKQLRLASLKTLPVVSLTESLPVTQVPGTEAGKPSEENVLGLAARGKQTVYKHAVEIVVQGEYNDLIQYLSQLENMPWQLFWEAAHMNAATSPTVSLKLTLFTISLDKQWLNI